MPRRMSAEALEKRLNSAADEQRASCIKAVRSSETPEVDTQAPQKELFLQDDPSCKWEADDLESLVGKMPVLQNSQA